MCRLAAYLGPEISLASFLLEPEHSLYRQSWQPREMEEAELNADGFGFAWRRADQTPSVYVDPRPIWADHNLPELGAALFSPRWLASVRSATPGQPVVHSNVQPFKSDGILFTHNGYIERFNPDARARFHEILLPEIQATIQGSTDSEYLFALLRQQRARQPRMRQCIFAMLETLAELIIDEKVLLNFIVCDGDAFHVLRHAINGHCPTLYISSGDDFFPDATVVASEALTASDSWQPALEHSYVKILNHQAPEFITL